MAVQEVTQSSISQFINHTGVTVIDFWAAWCRPCSQFAPVFTAVSQRLPEAVFLSVNTDQEQELARAYNVQSLPTVIVLVNGMVAYRRAGVMTAKELEGILKNFIGLTSS